MRQNQRAAASGLRSYVIKTFSVLRYRFWSVVTGADIVKPDGSKPFKKLFPVDSIIKANRPIGAGVKYGITGDVGSGTYRDPRSSTYPLYYRTYYPGADTYYKYWLSALGTGTDLTITYAGKTVLTNKVVARFEISHSTPGTWNIFLNGSSVASGTSAQIKAFGASTYDAGTLTIYYNGTSWVVSFDASSNETREYVTNAFTSQQFKFEKGEWTDTFQGIYESGYWRLELVTTTP